MLIVTPDIINTTEWQSVSWSFTISDDAESEPLTYELVNVSRGSSFVGLVYTQSSSTSFTLQGNVGEQFTRTYQYINRDLSYGQVSRIADLPSTFASMVRYVAPTPASKTDYITVHADGGSGVETVTIEVIIQNNWATANAMFAQHVKGSWT